MKVDISTLQGDEFKHVGSIRLVGGKAVAETKVQNCLVPSIPDPERAGVEVTPKDGERYLRLLPPELSHSYIEAVLDAQDGE